MKHSILLVGIMFALAAPINLAWGENLPEKPAVAKKPATTKKHKALKKPATARKSPVKAVQPATEMVAAPPAPTIESLAPVSAATVATPTPIQATAIGPETPSATTPPAVPEMAAVPAVPAVTAAILIAPPQPAIVYTPLPAPAGNPYLQNVLVRPAILPPPMVVVPVSKTNPFENLKPVLFSNLTDGLGQMHPPLYWELTKGPGKPVLVIQVSCPTKALFGFDTPVIAALQLGVDQLIELANGTNLLPAEIQRVCR